MKRIVCALTGNDVVIEARAEDEVPAEISAVLPEASRVAYATLEPIGADQTGYVLFEKTVRSLARQSGGMWVDPNGQPFGPDEGSF